MQNEAPRRRIESESESGIVLIEISLMAFLCKQSVGFYRESYVTYGCSLLTGRRRTVSFAYERVACGRPSLSRGTLLYGILCGQNTCGWPAKCVFSLIFSTQMKLNWCQWIHNISYLTRIPTT